MNDERDLKLPFMGIVDKRTDEEIHKASLEAALERVKPDSDDFDTRFLYLVIETITTIFEDDGPLSADAHCVLHDIKEIAIKRQSFLYHQECKKNKMPNELDYNLNRCVDSGYKSHNQARDLLKSLGFEE